MTCGLSFPTSNGHLFFVGVDFVVVNPGGSKQPAPSVRFSNDFRFPPQKKMNSVMWCLWYHSASRFSGSEERGKSECKGVNFFELTSSPGNDEGYSPKQSSLYSQGATAAPIRECICHNQLVRNFPKLNQNNWLFPVYSPKIID